MDLKIFVVTDDDIRLGRRILRDVSDRGRDIVSVLTQYHKFVKPSYDEFIKPTMRYANVIIPFNSDNTEAVDFICTNIQFKLQKIQHWKKIDEAKLMERELLQ